VIVPKKNTNIRRVCVDYTTLNKHCPKDPFPLPRIDQIFHGGLCKAFLPGRIFWYNQIKVKVEDK
jgi:hypothetical protein